MEATEREIQGDLAKPGTETKRKAYLGIRVEEVAVRAIQRIRARQEEKRLEENRQSFRWAHRTSNAQLLAYLSQFGPVLVRHYRYTSLDGDELLDREAVMERYGNGRLVLPRGGSTCVQVSTPHGVYIGSADCSRKDAYSKRLGLRIALGRLLLKVESFRADQEDKRVGAEKKD